MGKANTHLFHHLTNTCQVSTVCQAILDMVIEQTKRVLGLMELTSKIKIQKISNSINNNLI